MVSSRRVRAAADVLAGVDVDGHQRFGVVDDDVAAGLEPHLGAQRLVEFLLDAELLEDRRGLGVELDAADQLGLEAADELDDLAELLFVVDPDGGVVVADVVAQDALDEIEIAMQQRRAPCAARPCARIFSQVRPRNSTSARISSSGAPSAAVRTMKPPGKVPLASRDQAAQARTLFGGADAARDADVIDRGHVDQEAAGQRDVAGDARALFAQRLLGDLHDDFLAGLQHFGDQLRAALRLAAGDPAARGRPPPRCGRPPRRMGRWKRARLRLGDARARGLRCSGCDSRSGSARCPSDLASAMPRRSARTASAPCAFACRLRSSPASCARLLMRFASATNSSVSAALSGDARHPLRRAIPCSCSAASTSARGLFLARLGELARRAKWPLRRRGRRVLWELRMLRQALGSVRPCGAASATFRFTSSCQALRLLPRRPRRNRPLRRFRLVRRR